MPSDMQAVHFGRGAGGGRRWELGRRVLCLTHETHQRALPAEINGGGIAQQEAETKSPREHNLSKRLRSLSFLKWKAQTQQDWPNSANASHEGIGPARLG